MQQSQLIAGDSLNFTVAVENYAPGDGWQLKYRLVPRVAGGAAIDINAAASGSMYLVQVGADVTAGWTAGVYSWASWVDLAGEVYTVATGTITILPDPRQAAPGYDNRTTAQIALEQCEAAMATFNATGGKVKKYEIAGRSMEFQTIGDLMQLHSFWRIKVDSEKTASDIAKGIGNPRNFFIRHVRPQ